jgi:hypothetical protein
MWAGRVAGGKRPLPLAPVLSLLFLGRGVGCSRRQDQQLMRKFIKHKGKTMASGKS